MGWLPAPSPVACCASSPDATRPPAGSPGVGSVRGDGEEGPHMFGQLPEPPPCAGAVAVPFGAVLWLLSPCWVWVELEPPELELPELESLDWAYATAEYPPTRAPATASVARPLRQRVMVITSSRCSRCSVVRSNRGGVRAARESTTRVLSQLSEL